MKKKFKTLFSSILCLSMVTGYCLPIFANEENLAQDVEARIEENPLQEEIENVDGAIDKVESMPEVQNDVVETLPTEDPVPSEGSKDDIDLCKTDVFTVTYTLRPSINYSLEKTKFVNKTFTSQDFPKFDDSKMKPNVWGSDDMDYFECFDKFVLQNAPEGFVPFGKGATGSRVEKESNFAYSYDMMEIIDENKITPIFIKFIDQQGNPIYDSQFDSNVTYRQGKEVTSLNAELINAVPLGYTFDGTEFDVQTINGEKYAYVKVKKAPDNRMFRMIFLEQEGEGYKRVDMQSVKLSDVIVKDELGKYVVKEETIKPFIKNGYVLSKKDVHGPDYVFWDYLLGQKNPLIITNPTAEIVVKKEYTTNDVIGPMVNDDLNVPNVGITITPEVKTILEDSIVDDTLKTNIKKAIEEGKKVTIEVDYNTENVDKNELSLVSDFMDKKGMKLVQSFDLGISVVTEDGKVLGQITETSKPLTFNLSIPKNLNKEGRKFHVVRVHNGNVNELNMAEDVFYTFTTNQFSTYALGYTDESSEENGVTTPETKPNTPQDKEETQTENKKDDSVGTATETNAIHFMSLALMSLGVLLLVMGIKMLESNR